MLAFACSSAFTASVRADDFTLVGDSTVASGSGWGDMLAQFLSPGDSVTNLGSSGRSTKSYINENRWQNALGTNSDYILIQFGHNDQKIDNDSVALRAHAVDNPNDMPNAAPITQATTTSGSDLYRVNLRRMIDDVRNAGAVPILVTSVARRDTDNHTSVQAQIDRNDADNVWPWQSDDYGNAYSLHDYADAAKAVGLEKSVAVIDLNQLSLDLYAEMIENNEDIRTLGPDVTHFNEAGGERIAGLVAGALPEAIEASVPEPGTGLVLLSLMTLGARRRRGGRMRR